MRLQLASIAARAGTGPAQQLLEHYLARTIPYLPIEAPIHRSEAAFLDSLSKPKTRTPPIAILLDPRGRPLSSEQLAALLDTHKHSGTQLLTFAIGPADGWTPAARAQAHSLLSLGPMTLPHELARLLLAEQLYRACTILANHPYHSGH